MLLSVILCVRHVGTIEVGEIVAPQGIAGLDFIYGILYCMDAPSYRIQYLLVQQLYSEPACKLRSNLVSTRAELAADGNYKILLLIHSK